MSASAPQFVHLRVHTEYSLTDSIVRVEPPKRKGGGAGTTLTGQVAKLRQVAAAVTDRMNLFAMVKFYKAAESAGIKPVIGADLWLQPRGRGEAPERLSVLVADERGYRNLTWLISQAYTEGQGCGEALVEWAWLEQRHHGLLALSGRDGAVFRAAALRRPEDAVQRLAELQALFGDRLYLEISRCGRPGDEDWVRAATALARLRALPLVATNDVRFVEAREFEAHEARVCIAQGRALNDERRPRDYTAEQYLKSTEAMAQLFADLPEAIANSVEIARRCTLKLSFGVYHLPNYPVPEGSTTAEYLRHSAHAGLQRRLASLNPAVSADEYRERLDYELGIIEQMKFPGYFLVVADFIEWAKTHGCPVGPGRGSGAGSLVAFSLGITDLDPLPYNLLFERFLNPERVSMPDFDVDFCMDNRDRVIDYVSQKYGRSHTGQIITYATMAARGVVRDVTRIMGHPFGFGDRIAKLIPGTPGATLVEAVEEVPELKKAYDEEEDVRAVLDLALELEGITRGVGVHAGGVVIAPEPLVSYTPLFCEASGDGLRTQFDMKDLESIGLVKFDFLGLKTLTVIQEAVDSINAQRSSDRLDVLALPLTDAKVYETYASGKTTAVFQMESPGMQKAAQDLKPDCFEDIIALVSLYRPGPMDLIPDYCARKRGDSPVEYLHPDMEQVLKPTYGIFVYQEQVMQMSQRMAGYSLGGADLLRRAMGKKKADEMATQRAIFGAGAEQRGVPRDVSMQVFDLMEKFANYGFNKSHAAAYALVSYHTAWLKTHYPAEFMAAVLSCEMNHTEAVVTMIDECKRMNLAVNPPDINRSHLRFTVAAPRQIAYGLGAIRGVGESALSGIIGERAERGPFTDLFDFCARIDLRKVNKRVLEALINAGALDGFGLNRPSLHATLPTALAMAEKAAEAEASGQEDMFGLTTPTAADPARRSAVEVSHLPDWDLRERLARERETLGFYLSGHPIEASRQLIDAVCSGRLRELIAAHAAAPTVSTTDGKPIWQPRSRVLFGAWVVDVRFFKGDKAGDVKFSRASYKITLDDQTAQISTWVDAEAWLNLQRFVKLDALIFVMAELGASVARDGRESEPRLYAAEFIDPQRLMAEYTARLTLQWGKRPLADVARLARLLAPYRDGRGAPVTVELRSERARATLDLGSDWRLRAEDEALQAVRQLLGAESVAVAYRKYTPPQVERKSPRSFAGSGGDDDE